MTALWLALLVAPPPDIAWQGLEASEALAYRVIESPTLPPEAPILIAIHGLGDSSIGFEKFARRLNVPFRIVIPEGPKAWRQGKRGRSWYRIGQANAEETDVESSTHRLITLIDHLQRRWPEAPAPLVIGFSQGGVMGYQLAARHPTKVSAVVSIAGYLVPRELRPKKTRGGPPLLIVHGRRDKRVLFELGRDAETRFREAGYDVELFAHDGGHNIPKPALNAARRWLLQHAHTR